MRKIGVRVTFHSGERNSTLTPIITQYLKLLAFAIISLFVTACVSTYEKQTITTLQSKLTVGESVLIATPLDGAYGDENYSGSGSATTAAVKSAFSRFSNDVEISTSCNNLQCLKLNTGTFGYYVVPEILQWEDRATEWSGKPDRIEVKVTVHDKSGSAIASQIISGKSKWATFGGGHPQDLLPDPLNEYIKSLYQ